MKKIIITGANSYIGTSFERLIRENNSGNYQVQTIDMIDGSWREKSFAGYDVVFHVAGIAHQKETKENAHLYYEINRDLATEVAKKAKADGIKQFVFLSSMSVYGMDTGVITKQTKPNPKSNYGKSKLQAEKQICNLIDDTLKVCVLRPPMVYGKNCKGNYNTIIKIVKMFPFFPRVNNKRSMVHIDTLVAFIKKVIDEELDGLFFPQDDEYVKTMELAKNIATEMGKRIYMSYLLGLVVICFRPFSRTLKKAFGSLIYKF